jgi:hypothetical protein
MEATLCPASNLSEAARADAPAGRIIPSDDEALLFQSEAAYLLGNSARTLEAWRLQGGGPPFIALGRRTVRYRRGDLLVWIAARRRRSTSDIGEPRESGR